MPNFLQLHGLSGILHAGILEPFPSPGVLPNPGIEPRCPTLQADSLPTKPPGKPKNTSPVDLPDPGIKLESPALEADSLPAEQPGKPRILECVAYPFFSGSSWPRNQTGVSCIAGRFFTNWATRRFEARLKFYFSPYWIDSYPNTTYGITIFSALIWNIIWLK